jgi:stage II sporulation protein D
MRGMRVAGAVMVALGAAACAGRGDWSAVPRPLSLQVQIVERGERVVVGVPLEEYVAGVIVSEFAPAAGDTESVRRMLEVQAVISRTYAVAHRGRHGREGFDACATTHCQLYEPARRRTSRWAPLAAEAVARTRGHVLWFGNAPALAVFHADCGGRTSASADVWGGTLPYLAGVDDGGPAGDAHTAWAFAADADALRRALNADPRTAVGARLDGIEVVHRDAAGRAALLRFEGEHARRVRGEDFRAVAGRAFGPRAIRSTSFVVERRGGDWRFTGRGFGHGVGLCQAGALARLAAGARPADVLAHFFPGTTLRTAR